MLHVMCIILVCTYEVCSSAVSKYLHVYSTYVHVVAAPAT